ncbi:dihydrolipoamide dehydrogenase [Aromatoleum tolulyticum]|uniref:Dihydrolipoamide dehydrogenase n=1 Tax=Aromatoleum tolulyticum TaxID=34027 RepID=A0A1N6XYQ4_9RHOO|nr:dihydrolipoyl dehydrogenase [Aromatoleum tolulyticum]SIR07480.1 dihydrolipoamide dehydrogenase [Aromatoleum tolulyticum]
MKTVQVDVAVVGAGTAGLAAFHAARKAGAGAVIIEGGEYGTTCARVGCMPSKLLIAAAEAAHAVGRAAGFGVHANGGIRIDGHAVMDRVRRERDRFVSFVLRDVEDIADAERIRGQASFVDDHTLVVADHTRVTSKAIVIATGSRATYPDSFESLGDCLITSDDVFDWYDLPKAVAVIGPGIVGLELGQALHRLGVRVAVLGRGGRVGPISDPEIRAYACATLNEEFTLAPDAHIADMHRYGDRVAIRRAGPTGAELMEYFDYVLAATGRTPNVTDIGLDRTTLELDAKGVPVFDPLTTRTVSADGASPIFIAGDAGNYIPLLHEATDEGRIAGHNAARLALGSAVQPGLRRARIGVVFTDPQIGIVGGGLRALKPGTFATGQASFEDQGRSRILLRNKGLLNLYGEVASGRFLGAEMLAPAAEHLAHLLAWALQNRMTVAQMREMPLYHPVIEEGLRTALRDLDIKLGAARGNAGNAA